MVRMVTVTAQFTSDAVMTPASPFTFDEIEAGTYTTPNNTNYRSPYKTAGCAAATSLGAFMATNDFRSRVQTCLNQTFDTVASVNAGTTLAAMILQQFNKTPGASYTNLSVTIPESKWTTYTMNALSKVKSTGAGADELQLHRGDLIKIVFQLTNGYSRVNVDFFTEYDT
jgi:hypothetical protein